MYKELSRFETYFDVFGFVVRVDVTQKFRTTLMLSYRSTTRSSYYDVPLDLTVLLIVLTD